MEKSTKKLFFLLMTILELAKCISMQDQNINNAKLTDIYDFIGEISEEQTTMPSITIQPAEQITDIYDFGTDCGNLESTKCICDCETIVESTTKPIEMNTIETETTTKMLSDELFTTDIQSNRSSNDKVSETEITTMAPTSRICSSVGNFTYERDCQLYYTCTIDSVNNNSFNLALNTCGSKTFFNSEYKRCTRAATSCSSDGFICAQSGKFVDSQNKSSYFLCIPRLMGGFHKYHIECSQGHIFIEQLGKCYLNINDLDSINLQLQLQNSVYSNEESVKAADSDDGDDDDEADAIDDEIKQFKREDKLLMKQFKKKEKLERKQAMKAQKEAEKNEKNIIKFMCVETGNFADINSVDSTDYFACVNKNDQLQTVKMKCSTGFKFDQQLSGCAAQIKANN